MEQPLPPKPPDAPPSTTFEGTSNFGRVWLFFALVLLIGAVGYGPSVLNSYGLAPETLAILLTYLGGASPTIAAVVVAHKDFGKSGPKYLFFQFGRHPPKISIMWILLAPCFAVGIVFLSIGLFVMSRTSTTLSFVAFGEIVPLTLAQFLLNMWEETGWRGYAQPRLQERFSTLTSSLIIGFFWTLWHWPFFVLKDSAMMVNYHNFLLFAASTIANSIIYAWLYNVTKGNLLGVSLFHAATNAANFLLFTANGISYDVFPFYLAIQVGLALVLLVAFKPSSLAHRPKVTFPSIIGEYKADNPPIPAPPLDTATTPPGAE